jgi:integrase
VRKNHHSLVDFSETLCRELRANGQDSTAKAYRMAVNRIVRFGGNSDISLEYITPELIRRYDRYLLEDGGLMPNSVSYYLRNLRAICNRAVKAELIPPPKINPFLGVHTGVYRTSKRALTVDETHLLSMLSAQLSASKEEGEKRESGKRESGKKPLSPALSEALFYFFFCMHARGMSYVDAVFLKKSDITGERIEYRRRKTGKRMSVFITAPMQRIIEYFSGMTEDSPYVFPIINPEKGGEYRQYQTSLSLQNRRLGKLGNLAGILKNLTTHVARHTWATFAKKENVPVALISECLGHRDVKTTETYLGAFDISEMDLVSRWISGVISPPEEKERVKRKKKSPKGSLMTGMSL